MSKPDEDDRISPYLRKPLRKYAEVIDEINRRHDPEAETAIRKRGERVKPNRTV